MRASPCTWHSSGQGKRITLHWGGGIERDPDVIFFFATKLVQRQRTHSDAIIATRARIVRESASRHDGEFDLGICKGRRARLNVVLPDGVICAPGDARQRDRRLEATAF